MAPRGCTGDLQTSVFPNTFFLSETHSSAMLFWFLGLKGCFLATPLRKDSFISSLRWQWMA